MKRATLKRGESTDQGTFGVLQFGARVVRSLELPWRDNARRRSCIPPGAYRCTLVRSPRFGSVYLVNQVPGRSDVLLHPANFAGDVDLATVARIPDVVRVSAAESVIDQAAVLAVVVHL